METLLPAAQAQVTRNLFRISKPSNIYFIRNDSNGFLNMDIPYTVVKVDSFIFVDDNAREKKHFDLFENNTVMITCRRVL